jgi:crossover junction endodeoxyribonuclease RuvC
MLQRITLLPNKPKYFDATDALAVAICHHFGSKVPVPKSTTTVKKTKKASWEAFARENPKRIQ